VFCAEALCQQAFIAVWADVISLVWLLGLSRHLLLSLDWFCCLNIEGLLLILLVLHIILYCLLSCSLYYSCIKNKLPGLVGECILMTIIVTLL